jgi:hypothetical protein
LRDLPISWPQVKQLRADRRGVPLEAQSVWKARTQIQLADRFREHYRRVRDAAE